VKSLKRNTILYGILEKQEVVDMIYEKFSREDLLREEGREEGQREGILHAIALLKKISITIFLIAKTGGKNFFRTYVADLRRKRFSTIFRNIYKRNHYRVKPVGRFGMLLEQPNIVHTFLVVFFPLILILS